MTPLIRYRCSIVLLTVLATAGTSEAASACPESIRAVGLQKHLIERYVPDPERCLHRVPVEDSVELLSVEYGELDGEPGEEAVVRGMTCHTGSAVDISKVFKLQCADDGNGWSLVSLPFEIPDRGRLPGEQRHTPVLAIDETRLTRTTSLYREGDPNSEGPSWESVATYLWRNDRFVVESISTKALEDNEP